MKTPGYYDENDEFHELPTKWVICNHCRGEGKSSAYLGAFSGTQMRDEDPDFEADYFAGHYDRTCEECNGTGKIKEIDEARVTKEQMALYEKEARIESEMEREAYNEWLFCGGWREMGWR